MGEWVQRWVRCLVLAGLAALLLSGTSLAALPIGAAARQPTPESALAKSALAKSAAANRASARHRARVRSQLRRAVKRHPGVVRKRWFLRKAALVNFKLPVTIRLRNPCSEEAGQNPYPTTGGVPLQVASGPNCLTQGTALNQRSIPTATVNLGPSLGSRQVALGGGLSAVVEFSDTYDGGALGNVNLKILPGNKTLTSSSVPLLWNEDISGAGSRSDANTARSATGTGGLLQSAQSWADPLRQGCRDWMNELGGGITPAGYNPLFYGAPADLGFGTGAGMPGYPVYTGGGSPSGVYLPIVPGADNPELIQSGGFVGNNDFIGPNPNPFPTGSAPVGATSNAADTVLRTNALSLGIAPGGVSVNMSTGTSSTPGGLTTAQGSQDVTLGYSGGQANLFGNIPGKNVGIDVTVNLATRITGIARIMDQDVFKQPMLIEGDNFPAGYYNCRQVFTGAVQNYIPGVRLTGSLRIAPAITKDGRVRIAKATVQSDVNNPDRVALSACLFPSKPFNAYTPGSTDSSAVKVPTLSQVNAGGAFFGPPSARLVADGNTSSPEQATARYPNGTEGGAPTTIPCGADTSPELADIIRSAGLTGTVSGIPTPSDPAFAGVSYRGDQASVAGDITVHPIDVDVLLGDVSAGVLPVASPTPPPPFTATQYPVLSPASNPADVTQGADGNVWFTTWAGNTVGRVTPSGTVTEFPIPTPGSGPRWIALGPDGNVWFAEQNGNNIGRVTPSGVITEYPLPNPGSVPWGIVAGPDGNLWFTEMGGNRVGRITPAGVITEYPLPNPGSLPFGIDAGPDGNLWFAELAGNRIGRITPAGVITEFSVPTAASQPFGITAGPDGNLWFTETNSAQVGRITPAGVITEFSMPTPGTISYGITAGSDGNLWFTGFNTNSLGRVTPSGSITEYQLPTPGNAPAGIKPGPDGALWFADWSGNNIGRHAP